MSCFLARLLFMAFCSLALVGCGGKRPKTQTDFTFSVGAIVNGIPMDGGITMQGVRYDESGNVVEELSIDLPEDHMVTLPSGDWDLFFVGYTGPSEWTGTNYCGVIDANLTTESATLNVTIDQTTCLNEPYVTIISEKAAANTSTWDTTLWDGGTWGP